MSNWKPAVIAAIIVGVLGIGAGVLNGGVGGEGETTTVVQSPETTESTTPTGETTTPAEETTTPAEDTTTSPEDTTTATEEGATYLSDLRRTGRLMLGDYLTDFGAPQFRAVTIGEQTYERGIGVTVPSGGSSAQETYIAVPLEPRDEHFTTAFGVESNPGESSDAVNIQARADDPLGQALSEKVLVEGSDAPAGTLDLDIPADVETLYLVIREQSRVTIDPTPASAVLGDPRLTAAG